MITNLYREEVTMAVPSTFDWYSLDRANLAQIVCLVEKLVTGKPIHPLEIIKQIRSIFRQFDIPLNFRSCYNKKTDKNSVWVGGLYDAEMDKKVRTPITIILQFKERDQELTISRQSFKKLALRIADTVLHEIVHLRQYRRRFYKTIPGYYSFASSGKQRIEQTYLGHPDEIDAYSFNIASDMIDYYGSDIKKITDYLNSDLRDKRIKKTAYKMYLDAFDHDHTHHVIRTLKKKIMNYLPNAYELGKPYRTTDWLKK